MKRSPGPSTFWTVPSERRAVRLDAFVRLCLPHLSLREAQKAIEEKAFWIHDRPGKKGDRLFGGDVVAFKGSPVWLLARPLAGQDLELPILFEDPFVLVVDKPAGVATHGYSGRQTKTLANFLVAIRPSLAGVGKSRWEPGLVHRLDQDTSGVVLVAKDQDSFEELRSQFRQGQVTKRYWALVWGKTLREGMISYPLARDPRDRKKMRALKEARRVRDQPKKWRALTRFRLLNYSRGFSLLEIEIETGVTHQIRVHLQAVGHPLVGDPLYASIGPDPFGLGRQFLHAFYLEFRHPKSGQSIVVRSPLPKELGRVLDDLGIRLQIQ